MNVIRMKLTHPERRDSNLFSEKLIERYAITNCPKIRI